MSEQPLTGHERPGDPCTIVIFGASGDLTKRKLLPALYNLKALKLLPTDFAVIGNAVTDGNDEMYRKQITEDIKQFATRQVDEKEWSDFANRSYYIQGDFNSIDTFKHLAAKISDVRKTWNLPGNVLFYLAVAPRFFAKVVEQLNAVGLTAEETNAWRRIIVEKPFGHDLASARELNSELQQERQGIADLSHRSLPRQGDRAEHHGLPLWEFHLRAHLEPALYRIRSDHGR